MDSNGRKVITFCPKCQHETFEVVVINSGSGPNHEFGQTDYWFYGDGKCTDCGFESEYGDSSL